MLRVVDTPARKRMGKQVRGTLDPQIQRKRLFHGAVRAIDELGYAKIGVSEIAARSHVSRRTFYELFSDCEDCLAGVLEDTVERLRGELARAGLERLRWRERVRGGLWTILCFLDREPLLARVTVLQSARGGEQTIALRERVLGELAGAIDAGRREDARGKDCSAITAEGLVGATLSIVHSRLLRGEQGSLSKLQNELMAMIVLPYLGPAAARQERTRKASAVNAPGAHDSAARRQVDEDYDEDPLAGLSIRLTYRTMRVLEVVAQDPGLSNRGVGASAGIADQGQISKLLRRLQDLGLLENRSPIGKGEANAWALTPGGERVLRSINPQAVGSRVGEAA